MTKKIAVLLYLYNNNLLDEYVKLLKPIKSYISLYVGLCSDYIYQQDSIRFLLDSNFTEYTLNIYENKGLDIGPFLLQLDVLDASRHSHFIKLHSKQSLWGQFKNINWRIPLVNSLIGNKKIFLANKKLCSNKHIGMIGNTGFLLNTDKEGLNGELIENIATEILGIPEEQINRTDLGFLAGSIFWARTDLFKQYFTTQAIKSLYSQLDYGRFNDREKPTHAHALERLFGYIVSISGLHIADGLVDDKIHITNPDTMNSYDIVCCYNNQCYMSIDSTVSGLYYSLPSEILINWKHKSYNGIWKKYRKISPKTYQTQN